MNADKVDLNLARQTLKLEGQTVAALAETLGEAFACAARDVYACPGTTILTGIGKAGIVARKVSGTLASTGTPSIYLHPVEALHGDLGRVHRDDVVIALSHSGASEEIIRLVDHIKARGAKLIALTGSQASPLGRHADVCLCYGDVDEACPLGLAPTVSTTCMLAVGDALALTVMQMRRFSPDDYAAFHPGGSLGRKLMKVEQTMTARRGERLCPVRDTLSLGEALAAAEKATRRAGAMLLVDGDGRLTGILTDADLRRLLVTSNGDVRSVPVAECMTRDPKHVHLGDLASEALAIFNEYRIDELPVLDEEHRPVGVIDVQDVLGIKTVNHVRD
ncbi:MAG: KpsF/GutQ family sugar-phosphate isomerase [Phycisphaerae bacterium]|nr:KpsF/GutQ family sugar-phosphate isomerase [Phycisphaerae bacterium]